ncbi:MAG TPA: lysylphosphatidylglycerol synthase domain-containing protein [Gaiellaceae bacterium]|nr:lysylphosphatidylglycerol synthase domain-containing protein [Gaiellaceae bacterium]
MRMSRTTLLVSAAALAALAAAALSPHLLGGRVGAGFRALGGADWRWLALAVLGFLGGFVCTVGAWRAALHRAGGRICPRQAAARLAVGGMVNSFAPAKLGDAVKVALCSRAIDGPGRVWTTGGVYAGLAAARSLALASVVVLASATGAMPLWPVFALCGLVGALALVASFSGRVRNHPRVAQLLEGFAALERSPRALATVLAWSFGMQAARLGATAAVAAALGVPHALLAALLILPALDVAAAFPITPGSIGVGSGAVAVALASRGIGAPQALGVGLGLQAVETLLSVSLGTAALLYLARPSRALRIWAVRGAAVAVGAAFAALLGAALFDLL